MIKETIKLIKLTADEGMVITDKKTETMRAEVVYLGKGDSEDNYKDIDENTPLPKFEGKNQSPSFWLKRGNLIWLI